MWPSQGANKQGKGMSFRKDGWFNATVAALRFKKRLQNYLDNKETVNNMIELAKMLNHSNQSDLIKASRGNGGGTWFHPELAVHFARWLDLKFSIWCDNQIDQLLRGNKDWRYVRHKASISYQLMQEMLKMEREAEDKGTVSYHYINEARMLHWALAGRFEGFDRQQLSSSELDVLAELEVRNTLLIGKGIAYEKRKEALRLHAAALTAHKQLMAPQMRLEAATPRRQSLGRAACQQ